MGRGSETQLQSSENLNKISQRLKVDVRSYLVSIFHTRSCNFKWSKNKKDNLTGEGLGTKTSENEVVIILMLLFHLNISKTF